MKGASLDITALMARAPHAPWHDALEWLQASYHDVHVVARGNAFDVFSRTMPRAQLEACVVAALLSVTANNHSAARFERLFA